MIELRVLGTADVRRGAADGEPARPLRLAPRELALLSHIALCDGRRSRDQLVGTFWPELPEARARAALSQSLYRLRQRLGREWLTNAGDDGVVLDADALWCDADDFLRRLADGDAESALDLYRGDLLAGFHLAAGPDFQQWLDDERTRMRNRAVGAAADLARRLEGEGFLPGSATRLRQALAWSPYEEPLARDLVRVLAGLGDRPGAVRQYEAFAARLAEDLDMEPSAALTAFVEQLRVAGDEMADLAPVPTAHPVAPPPPLEPPIDVPTRGDAATRQLAADESPVRMLRSARSRIAIALTATSIGLLVMLAFVASRDRRTDTLTVDARGAERLLIMPFRVVGGERFAFLGEGVIDMLGAAVALPGELGPIETSIVLRRIERIEPRADDATVGLQLARALNAASFVTGTIAQDGERAHIRATLYDSTGSVRSVVTSEIDEHAGVSAAIDLIATAILASRHPAPAGATASTPTTSLSALEAFIRGERAMRRGAYEEAQTAYRSAVTNDTLFALAYLRMSQAAGWTGAVGLSAWGGDQAFRYIDRLPEPERLLLLASRAAGTDRGEAMRLFRDAVERYPWYAEAHLQRADYFFHLGYQGFSAGVIREVFERALEIDPDNLDAILHLVRVAAVERRTEELQSLVSRANALESIGENGPELHAYGAIASKDDMEIARVAEEWRALDDEMLARITFRVIAFREVERTRPLAALLTEATRPVQLRALGHAALAFLHAGGGQLVAASAEATRAEALDPTIGLSARANLALLPFSSTSPRELDAIAGGLAGWRTHADGARMDVGIPMNDLVGSSGVWPLSGEIAAMRGDSPTIAAFLTRARRRQIPTGLQLAIDAALRADTARALDLIGVPVAAGGRDPLGLEAYLRGRFLEATGDAPRAAVWYAAFVHDIPFSFALAAPRHLGLARVYTTLGDHRAAAAEYARASEIWADCDPSLRSILEATRSALAPPPAGTVTAPS